MVVEINSPSGGGAAGSISAGTTNLTLGSLSFADSPSVSFGLDGNTITASVSPAGGGLTNINISGGTTSNNLSNLVFSDSNGVSFGLNGSTLTATVQTNYLTSQSNQAASASNGSFTFQTVNFSNANNVTFGTSAGSIISASVLAQSVQPGIAGIAAGGSTASTSTVNFSNSNGISFGFGAAGNSTVITGSHNALTSQSNQAYSAEGGSSAFQTLIFTNSNGISFSNTAGSIWGSHNALTSQSTQFIALTLGGNTAGTTTFHATNNASLFFHGGNNITLSGNGSTVTISAGAGGGAVVSNAIQDVSTATGSGTNTSRFAADDHVHRGIRGIVVNGTASTFFGDYVLSAGANITLNTAGNSTAGSVEIVGPAAGGAGTLSNYFEPFVFRPGQSASSSGSESQIHLMPMTLPVNLSFGHIMHIASVAIPSSSVGNTFSFRLTNVQSIGYTAVYSFSKTNFVDLFLFSRGTGGYSSELETFASTRNTFGTTQWLTYSAAVNLTAGSTGSMTVRSTHSMSVTFPTITSGTMTSVNAASTFTTHDTGYSNWTSSQTASITNTYNTTTTGSTSLANTNISTTAWASYKKVPLHFASSLTPGEYWVGMKQASSTSSSSTFGSTIATAGTGASYTVTYNASNMTNIARFTVLGDTGTLASSLGWLGGNTNASIGPYGYGHGSFSNTWASNSTYLNNAVNPNGAIAFTQMRTHVSFHRTWMQFASQQVGSQ